jgi:hypothetical protein
LGHDRALLYSKAGRRYFRDRRERAVSLLRRRGNQNGIVMSESPEAAHGGGVGIGCCLKAGESDVREPKFHVRGLARCSDVSVAGP